MRPWPPQSDSSCTCEARVTTCNSDAKFPCKSAACCLAAHALHAQQTGIVCAGRRTCGVGQHEALALCARRQQHARLPDGNAYAHRVDLRAHIWMKCGTHRNCSSVAEHVDLCADITHSMEHVECIEVESWGIAIRRACTRHAHADTALALWTHLVAHIRHGVEDGCPLCLKADLQQQRRTSNIDITCIIGIALLETDRRLQLMIGLEHRHDLRLFLCRKKHIKPRKQGDAPTRRRRG